MFESNELNQILKSELALGNKIAEDTLWPPKCRKLIILKRRFNKPYETVDLEYRKLNDQHYWYAEYSTTNQAECLACK